MAKLEVQIGADSSELKTEIAKAEIEIEKLRKQKAIDVKLGLDTVHLQKTINESKANLANLKKSVDNTGASFGGMAPKVANGGNALMQFSRIAQDAPYGMIGIGNNITATVEAFGHLKQSTGSAGGALKAMAGSIMGTGGILLAVSLVTTAFTYMSMNGISLGDLFRKLTGESESYASVLKKVNEEAYKDEGVRKAIQNVNELTNEISLAKQGFLDKDQVVKHYNETIGATTGLVGSLDEAEKAMVRNGDAYVKMMLYKASATLAQEDAARQSLEAEKSRVKKLSEFTNAFLDADLTQTRSKEQYDAKQENLKRQQENRRKAEVKINDDAAKANLSIAKKFQEEAAKISKDFNFNFFGDTKASTKKTPKAAQTFNTPQVEGVQSYIQPLELVPIIDTSKIKTSMNLVSQAISEEQVNMMIALESFNESASQIIEGSISDTFAGLGAAIGGAMASGGNVMKAAGQALLGGVGALLSNLGKMAIQVGVGLLGIKAALKTLNPAVAIGAGVALVALGAMFSSKASSMGSGMGSSSGGGSVQGGNSYSSPSSSNSGGGGGSFSGGTVVFEISGQTLIGVLSNTLDRNKRLGGALGL